MDKSHLSMDNNGGDGLPPRSDSLRGLINAWRYLPQQVSVSFLKTGVALNHPFFMGIFHDKLYKLKILGIPHLSKAPYL
jgi:hypothetical protein